MKILRSLSLGVLLALAIFFCFGLLMPSNYEITESVKIKASEETAFIFISDLSQWNNWAFDSIMLYQDQSDSDIYYWNDPSGKGEIAVKEVLPNKRIVIDISMVDGAFESESVFTITPIEVGDSITVTWSDTQRLGYNFIARYYVFFANFEETIANNYQNGLQKLKKNIENNKNRASTNRYLDTSLQDSSIETWQNSTLILKELGSLKNKVVAEIGAKGGYFTFKLKDDAAKVISLETHKSLFEKLKSRAANEENIEVRFTGVISPAIYEGEVEVVVMTHVWAELPQPYTYLQRVKRGIKTGGKLILLAFLKNVPEGYPAQKVASISDIKQTIESAGFNKVTVTELGNEQYMLSAIVPE